MTSLPSIPIIDLPEEEVESRADAPFWESTI